MRKELLADKHGAFSDTSILKALAWVNEDLNKRLSDRWAEMEDIADNAVDGKVWVRAWSRDCDHCTSTSIFQIEASWNAYDDRLNMMYDDAEGPCSLTVISEEQAIEFKPEFRDHILEAHEDGHPYSVAV